MGGFNREREGCAGYAAVNQFCGCVCWGSVDGEFGLDIYILHEDHGLTGNREVCFTYSGRKSFLRIARHGSLRRRLSASRTTRGVRLYLVNGER